ncbi:4'-phosphopantetheinyl transferase family protein [Alkalihalobacillus hemicellulosilyticus]|nr:4'-phosphopantetheinyl transferase superfamily protein [Halalkalibacter hemicellulosilyticus]
MIELFAGRIPSRIESHQFRNMLKHVSSEKQDKIKGYLRQEDALQSLLADLLIRSIIQSKLQIKNEKILFETNKYGKPKVLNDSSICYNISHSGEWIVCAVHSTSIGVDVEKIRKVDLGIAKQFFTREEQKDLLGKNVEQRLPYFFDLWTIKESYIKARGKGLFIPLNSFNVIKNTHNDIQIVTKEKHPIYYFKQYFLEYGYKLSVCAKSNDFPKKIKFVNLFDMYKNII